MPPTDMWGQGSGFFCANENCVLHIAADDPRVHGQGHWAEINGVLFDRHPIEIGGRCYCSACRSESVAA